MDDGMLAILLDIKEQNGSMEARLMEAARTSARMERNIDDLKNEVSGIKPVVATVARIVPEHQELMDLKNRGAAIVVVATIVITGALGLIAAGVKYFGAAILAALQGR